MKCVHICLALSLMLCSRNISAQPGATNYFLQLPEDGVPLAQIFDSRVADLAVYQQHANKVFFVWGSSSAQLPKGITGSKYFPSIRNPERKLDIDWYKKNHPDWIMYKADQSTPAYGYIYDYGGLVPLDVSNNDVKEYYLSTFIMPAVQQGYKVVAMDNVDLGNWPEASGHFTNGKWTPLYTGKKNDSSFQWAMIGWMQFLVDKLHPLGVKVAANIKANSASSDVVLRMMNTVDIWLDENGFTHTGKNVTGAAWEKQFSYLKHIAPTKGYVSINQVNNVVDKADSSQIEWVIANFLLTRGPQSTLAITGYDKKAFYQEFHYRPEMDVNIGKPLDTARKEHNVWIRHFQKGFVVVNPNATDTITFTLPKGKWKTATGLVVQGELALKPAFGFVLEKL